MSLAAMYSYRCDVLDLKVTRLEAERAEVWTAGYLAGQRAAAEGPQANPYAQAEPIPGYPRKAPA